MCNISSSYQGFKWFGSLTHISFRRSTEKSESKSSKSKSGAGGVNVPAHGIHCGTANILSPVAEVTVDDMAAMRPRTASYVRSSESYTHVGTLPRLLMKKKDKSNKGKAVQVMNADSELINFLLLALVFIFMWCSVLTGGPNSNTKNKHKGSLSRIQSQRPAADNNCEPQKLTANSVMEVDIEAANKADTGFSQDALAGPKEQSEPAGGNNIQHSSKDASPSGGSSTVLQLDSGNSDVFAQTETDLIPGSPEPPLNQTTDQIQDDGLEAESVLKAVVSAESEGLNKGADQENQNICMWVVIVEESRSC